MIFACKKSLVNKHKHKHKQCLEASTFSPFSKCFGNRFFCIFCKPYTYSHPFLTTLVSFKKIWPIYGYSHFWKPKNEQNWPQIWNYRKRRISGSQVPNMIGFYWTHPKLKILDQKCQLVLKNMISVSFCDEKIPNFELFSRIYARNSKKLQFGDISCNKYSKQTPSIISSYGETQANSYFSRKRHSKSTRQNWSNLHFFTLHPYNPHFLGSDGPDSMGS